MKASVLTLIIFIFLKVIACSQPSFNIISDLGLPTNHIRDMIVDGDHIVGMGMAYADSSFSQKGLLLVKYDSSGNFIASKLILDSLGDHLSVDKHWGKIKERIVDFAA